MRSIQSLAVSSLLALGGLFAVSGTLAQVPGPHPAYLHALSDLRAARNLLSYGGPNGAVDHHEDKAIGEIDAAIGEITRAAINDGKDVNNRPPADVHMERVDRFRNAEKMLHQAHDDIAQAEDVPQSRGLRNRALAHIDQAWHQTQDAMRDSGRM